jgi:putative oxidoreductase
MRAIYRIVVGLMFIMHGTQKLLGFPPSPMPGMPVDPMSTLGVAGSIELIGGALIVLGLLTRPVAFLLAGEMAVAYFRVHFPRGLLPINNGGEVAVLYCFAFLYLMLAGAGAWSLDAMIMRNRHRGEPGVAQRRKIDTAA